MLLVMFGKSYWIKVAPACVAVFVASFLMFMADPASAHGTEPHVSMQSSAQAVANIARHDAETGCHKSGTCVMSLLPDNPSQQSLQTRLMALALDFSHVSAASIPSATDPPPPRL